MSESFTSFTAADYEREGEKLLAGGTAVLPRARGAAVIDFADALARLGNVIGETPIKIETIGDDVHISAKESN